MTHSTTNSYKKFLFFFSLVLFVAIPCQINSKVIQVIQVIRHGARQSRVTQKGVRSLSKAQLTNRGFAQMIKFGNKTAKKYAKDLRLHSYNPSNVKIISSTPDRCMFSVKAFMYGFFWKKGKPKHMEYLRKRTRGSRTQWEIDPEVNLDLREFDIKRVSSKNNLLFKSHTSLICPQMKKLVFPKNHKKHKKFRLYVDKIFEELKKENFDINQHIKANTSRISQVKNLFEVLYIKYFSYPKNTPKPISFKLFRMIAIAKLFIHFSNKKFNKKVAKIASTPLLEAVRKELYRGVRMYRKKKKSRKKLVFYSGQASIMLSLMEVFGLTDGSCFKWTVENLKFKPKNNKNCKLYPRFAENFSFVVKEEDSKFFVELYFGEEMIQRKKFKEFGNFLKSLQVKNFDKSCYGPQGKPKSEDDKEQALDGDDLVLKDKQKREKFRQGKLNQRKFKDMYLIQKLEDLIGERPVELIMFGLFCGALFISFKYIYANFAIKQKLKSV
jgi:hypothetical protein